MPSSSVRFSRRLAAAPISWPACCVLLSSPTVPPYDTVDYSALICENGGIFNDIHWDSSDPNSYKIRFRADPDCNNLLLRNTEGVWHTFIVEIYWGLGLYAAWADDGQSTMSVYIDDMQIYDKADGVEVGHICSECTE